MLCLRHGLEVRYLGTENAVANILRFPQELEARTTRVPWAPPGASQKLRYVSFLVRVLAAIVRFNPRWLYMSGPVATPIGLLARKLGRRVVYHEHDLPQRLTTPLARFEAWCRRQLTKGAEIVVAPNRVRLDALLNDSGCLGRPRAYCIWNCPRQEEASPAPAFSESRGSFAVHYHGSINPTLLPLTLARALQLLPTTVHLSIAGYETIGAAGYVEEFLMHSRRLGVGPRVRYFGALPRRQLLALCNGADVGVCFFDTDRENLNHRAMVGASNKVFDYLSQGLVLLMGDDAEWRSIFEPEGVAAFCHPGDPQSIAAALRRVLEGDPVLRSAKQRGPELIRAKWNYEMQFAPVLAMLTANDRTAGQESDPADTPGRQGESSDAFEVRSPRSRSLR